MFGVCMSVDISLVRYCVRVRGDVKMDRLAIARVSPWPPYFLQLFSPNTWNSQGFCWLGPGLSFLIKR